VEDRRREGWWVWVFVRYGVCRVVGEWVEGWEASPTDPRAESSRRY
jgi:hypothetical protein